MGRITVKGQYRNGKRDGTWAFRSEGIVGHYKDGLKHGRWKYYENGQVVRREKYRKDKLRQGSTFLFGR
jgi:antitoxin component YwqK of YwqJK toxin-antitoxin module